MRRAGSQYIARRGTGRGSLPYRTSTRQHEQQAIEEQKQEETIEQKQEDNQIAEENQNVEETNCAETNGAKNNDCTEDHSYNAVEEDAQLASDTVPDQREDVAPDHEDLDGIDMEIIDEIDTQAEEDTMILNDEVYDTEPDVDQSDKELAAPETSHATAGDGSDDDLVETTNSVGENDDLVEFMSALGVRGSTGLMELTVAGVPPIQVVAAETREVRLNRKVVVENVLPSDLCSQVVQDLFNGDTGLRVKIEFDKPQIDCLSWNGKLEVLFCSAEAAADAASQLKMLREGMLVEQGKQTEDVSRVPAAGDMVKVYENEMKPWINLILIIKNIGTPSESCKAKLIELFPAADIAFHKDSPTELLKGQAYLVFGSRQQAAEAITKFKKSRPKIDGRRLILISWNINQILPEGMLKIGERRLVMRTMMDTEADLAKNQGDTSQLKEKYKALCEVVALDTKARHACGFPAPSYNQLKGLHDVRVYSDAEQGLILRRLLAPYSSVLAVTREPLKSVSTAVKVSSVKPPVERPITAKLNTPVGKSPKMDKPVETKSIAVIKTESRAKPLTEVTPPVSRPISGPRPPVMSGFTKQGSAATPNAYNKNQPYHNSKKRLLETPEPGRIVKKLGFKPAPPAKHKALPLLDLPMTKTGLLGSPPPIPHNQTKPLFRSAPQQQPVSMVRPLLPPPPLGRPQARESGSQNSFTRPSQSTGHAAAGGPRTGLLGSGPGDFQDDEPPNKLARVPNYRQESNELQWETRGANQSRFVDEEREILLARERLARSIDEGRMKSFEQSRSAPMTNWMDNLSARQSQVSLVNDFQQALPGFDRNEQLSQGRNTNRQEEVRSLMGHPPDNVRSLMGHPPDNARSIMGHPPDRGLINSNESVTFLRNEGPMRQQRNEWNQPGMLDDGPGPSYNNTMHHMVNSSNEARVGSNVLPAQSSSPLFARNQWSRGGNDNQEEFRTMDTSSSRWQTGGMAESRQQRSDSPLEGRQSSDQTDTVSLLLNLSQLLADKLQRDREKKRSQH